MGVGVAEGAAFLVPFPVLTVSSTVQERLAQAYWHLLPALLVAGGQGGGAAFHGTYPPLPCRSIVQPHTLPKRRKACHLL